MKSVGKVSELFGNGNDFHYGVTSLNVVVLLLGNFTNAWPTVLLDSEGPFHTVQIGSLVLSLFLGSLFTILEGYQLFKNVPFWISTSHLLKTSAGQVVWEKLTAKKRAIRRMYFIILWFVINYYKSPNDFNPTNNIAKISWLILKNFCQNTRKVY